MPSDQRDERTGAEREESTQERIEKRRSADKATEEREEEGRSQPESSAQKTPKPGPQP
jgi:hypothetical protein